MIRQFSLKRILIDGTIMNVLLSIVMYGSIALNPLIWVSDYPPDIQAAVGPVSVPIGQQLVMGVLFLLIVGGVPLWSSAKLRRENRGELSFPSAFVHNALLALYFAVWDLLILDWLIFVTIQPAFIIIPGTEGLAGYKEYGFHFQVSFLGWTQWIAILAAGLILGGLAMIRVGGKPRSGEEEAADYSIRNKKTLLKAHDQLASAGREIMQERCGEALTETVMRESRSEFEGLIPSLPYIGGAHNPLTKNLIQAAVALAFYRAMQRHGKTLPETGELLYRITEAYANHYPLLLRRLMGWYSISAFGRRRSRAMAARTHDRRYRGDWIRVHLDGDGKTFAWGADYLECGIVKFLHAQGADELAPYLCLTDYAVFGAMGIELKRTMTLAGGDPKCDFRLRLGASPCGWPPPWVKKREQGASGGKTA
jgi:hypothetical protein